MSSMDRISQLPEPIQLRILDFLEQKEVGRIACLSHTWRSIVQSRPVLEFEFKQRHEDTMISEEQCFMNHVESSIQRVVGQHLSIQKFSIFLHGLVPVDSLQNLDRLIQQLVEAKVQDLTLGYPFSLFTDYKLPPFVFMTETITQLRLMDCDLELCGSVRLPNLLKLSLECATLSQDMIEKITSHCPNLETLKLARCRGFSSVFISGLAKLKEVTLRSHLNVTEVKIVAPMLGVFKVSLERSRKIEIDLSGCESTLRMLRLVCLEVTNEELSSFVSKFLGLEELVLSHLPMTSVKIPNKRLGKLDVSYCTWLERIDIDAPNLRALKFDANKLPFYALNSRFPPNDTFDFYACSFMRCWPESLKEVFRMLGGHRTIKLIVYLRAGQERKIIVCEKLDEGLITKLYDVKDKVRRIEVVTIPTYEDLLHHLFGWKRDGSRGDRCENISIVSRDQRSNRKFLQILIKSIHQEIEESNCCRYKRGKCFKHSLKHVEVIPKDTTETLNLFEALDAIGYETIGIRLGWISDDF